MIDIKLQTNSRFPFSLYLSAPFISHQITYFPLPLSSLFDFSPSLRLTRTAIESRVKESAAGNGNPMG